MNFNAQQKISQQSYLSEPIHEVYPINFDLPIFLGGILGIGLAVFLSVSTKVAIKKEKSLMTKSRTLLQSPPNLGRVSSEDQENNDDLDFYDWNNLAQEAVGIVIAGNSGSAKTSLAIWALGKLTENEPAQVIILDPHANRNNWESLGLKAFSSFDLIEQQVENLIKLLDYRREQPNNGDTVIAVADELGANIKSFSNQKLVQTALERLGSEGRKYGIILVAINTSCNCEDIGISASSRNNFLTILCGAASRSFGENNWKKVDARNQWLNESAYQCVVTGAVSPAVARHPTHGHHKEFAITGKEPLGILPINQMPVNISEAIAKHKPAISDEAHKLLEWFRGKPDKVFTRRMVQQAKPLGRTTHKSDVLNPLLEELVSSELLLDEENGYKLLC